MSAVEKIIDDTQELYNQLWQDYLELAHKCYNLDNDFQQHLAHTRALSNELNTYKILVSQLKIENQKLRNELKSQRNT